MPCLSRSVEDVATGEHTPQSVAVDTQGEQVRQRESSTFAAGQFSHVELRKASCS